MSHLLARVARNCAHASGRSGLNGLCPPALGRPRPPCPSEDPGGESRPPRRGVSGEGPDTCPPQPQQGRGHQKRAMHRTPPASPPPWKKLFGIQTQAMIRQSAPRCAGSRGRTCAGVTGEVPVAKPSLHNMYFRSQRAMITIDRMMTWLRNLASPI